MTTQEAIDFFGGKREMAEALKITTQATYQWGDKPPLLRQFELERISGGKLKADTK